MSDLLTVTIDGVTIDVPKGTLVVDAAKRIQNDIPVFVTILRWLRWACAVCVW